MGQEDFQRENAGLLTHCEPHKGRGSCTNTPHTNMYVYIYIRTHTPKTVGKPSTQVRLQTISKTNSLPMSQASLNTVVIELDLQRSYGFESRKPAALDDWRRCSLLGRCPSARCRKRRRLHQRDLQGHGTLVPRQMTTCTSIHPRVISSVW